MSDEVKPELLEKTQKMLGKYITKPPLTEKLLRKPPFRFLHDVIVAVIRGTGFLNGLYAEAELVSENVKERDAKIAFLTKLIDAVKTITKTELSVKPSKVIAGLEPKETNKLLQAIATALDKKLSSESYVKELKSGAKSKPTSKAGKVKKSSSTRTNEDKESSRSKPKPKPKPKPTENQKQPKAEKTTKTTNKQQGKAPPSTNKVEQAKINNKNENVDPIQVDDEKVKEADQKEKETTHTAELDAPTTDINNQNVEIDVDANLPEGTPEITVVLNDENKKDTSQTENVEVVSSSKFSRSDRPKSARPQTAALRKENPADETKPPKNEMPARPMSSLRPPSVRPSSARPGAPRLRLDSALPIQESVQMGKINVIVENFGTKEADEEETVVIRTTDPNTEVQSVSEILDIPADKGHLVEQILEQIHEDDVAEHSKPKADDWEHDGFRNRDATNKEINQLRSSIQALTRVANPLGKLMNYLHEDVEAMHSELNMWVNMKKQIWNEINKQRRINKDANKPMRAQLDELEENIRKQEEEIRGVRFNILRNELRIKELLIK